MKKRSRKPARASLYLSALFLVTLVILSGPVQAVTPDFLAPASAQAVVEARMAAVHGELEALTEGEMTTVIVTLRNQADLTHVSEGNRASRLNRVITILQNQANATQNHLQALLRTRQEEGLVATFESFWVFNGLAVTATAEVVEELAARPEVALITPNSIDIEPSAQTSGATPEANLSVVDAPALWDLGYRGQGIVVANMDTGVYKDHPDLAGRWRGGANSWFDPYGQHPLTPVDYDGHGTWTMGAMVGGDAGGTSIGMAPDAQWIAVKIFDDSGQSTAAGIHAGYQWLLDPDGDPGTADAPHVVNNSWSFSSGGCDLEFQPDLLSLRAAGILPVFAAGNAGPSGNSSRSPANNPGAFAVGATDNGDLIYYQSSRGPSSCDAGAVFPELVAPGVTIRTADSQGYYYTPSGTSLAAPHVAGALALLLTSSPDLTADVQEDGLIHGAVDLGSIGPDDDYGYGRLDVLAALQWLSNNPAPTPTPSPTAADNLALGKSVTVSSKDGNHNGTMAVDSDSATDWRTKTAGRRSSSEEWIEVDLGATAVIDSVTLVWNENFATGYVVESSEDGSDWVALYGTTAGNGGADALTFAPAPARYVRMVSTAWQDSSLRNWLAEFEIYGTDTTPAPTSTSTPTDTATPGPTATTAPTPTPTPTADSQSTMHLGGLDGSSRRVGRDWRATVTVLVHANGETPLSGATVTGAWSNGYTGIDSCVTGGNGSCSLTTPKIDRQQGSVSFQVQQVSFASYPYVPQDNHDPAGDAVTVFGP